MDIRLREAQKKFLEIFVQKATTFAIAGGTALELYYLNHRFSADLDFFSPRYEVPEIEKVVSAFSNFLKRRVKLETEFTTNEKAKVRFYTVSIRGSRRPLKIDFVEDVIFKKPKINKFKGVRVYSAKSIYLQKLLAITGTTSAIDDIGRQIASGRREARDVFDMYMLYKKIKPLNMFLKEASPQIQRGIIHWYRTFSRQDCKLALLDLDIYDKKFNAKDMIVYLEREIEQFMKNIIE